MLKTINYKKNWLIALAGVSLCLAIFILIILGKDFQYTGSRNFSNHPIYIIIFSTLFLAPLLEELSYRGMFVKNKKMKIISFVTLSIFTLILQKVFLIPLLVILLFSFYGMKWEKKLFFNIAIASNITLFALAHYEVIDFLKFETLFFILFQVTIGSMCIWITLNFSLIKSIFFHFSWNLVFLIILIHSLQFPDPSPRIIKGENFTIEWKKVPKFSDSKSIVEFSEDSLIAENIEANTLYKFLEIEENSTILQYEPFMKYNIRVKMTEPTKKPEIKELTKEFLSKELVFKQQ